MTAAAAGPTAPTWDMLARVQVEMLELSQRLKCDGRRLTPRVRPELRRRLRRLEVVEWYLVLRVNERDYP